MCQPSMVAQRVCGSSCRTLCPHTQPSIAALVGTYFIMSGATEQHKGMPLQGSMPGVGWPPHCCGSSTSSSRGHGLVDRQPPHTPHTSYTPRHAAQHTFHSTHTTRQQKRSAELIMRHIKSSGTLLSGRSAHVPHNTHHAHHNTSRVRSRGGFLATAAWLLPVWGPGTFTHSHTPAAASGCAHICMAGCRS